MSWTSTKKLKIKQSTKDEDDILNFREIEKIKHKNIINPISDNTEKKANVSNSSEKTTKEKKTRMYSSRH